MDCNLIHMNHHLNTYRLEPILATIQADRTTMIQPAIASISPKDLMFRDSAERGNPGTGGFTWSMSFQWIDMQQKEQERRKSPADPVRLHRSNVAIASLLLCRL